MTGEDQVHGCLVFLRDRGGDTAEGTSLTAGGVPGGFRVRRQGRGERGVEGLREVVGGEEPTGSWKRWIGRARSCRDETGPGVVEGE